MMKRRKETLETSIYELLFKLGFMVAPAIVVIVFGTIEVLKARMVISETKNIPAYCMLIGAVLGPIAYFIIPAFPAKDIMSAVAVGIVSGAAATGLNEASKLLKKD